MKKLTPVLFVEEIEPCLDFWVQRLGFTKTVELPEGDKLGFVILVNSQVEVMLQSRASVHKDVPSLARGPFQTSGMGLYIEVEDLAALREALKGCDIVVPERKTFYGMHEIGVRAPGGCTVLLAARVGK